MSLRRRSTRARTHSPAPSSKPNGCSATSFTDLRVGLLHGRLSSRDKEETMCALRSRRARRAGLDDRRRGRRGRRQCNRDGRARRAPLRTGAAASASRTRRPRRGEIISASSSIPTIAGERERLEILTRETDGFKIADEDLRLRGPGQLAGTVQSGGADLRLGDLVRDIDVYRAAKPPPSHRRGRSRRWSAPSTPGCARRSQRNAQHARPAAFVVRVSRQRRE